MAVNIYEVSEAAGVSIATVSRVLNNSPKVSEKTKQLVLSVVESLGYTPNAFAQGLSMKSMKTVGILCADSSDTFFAALIYHLEEALRQNGYNCILCSSGHALERKKESVAFLQSKLVDALILLGSTYMEKNPQDIEYLLRTADHIPIICINSHFKHPNIFCVENDPYNSVYTVTKLALDSGRKKPVFLFRRSDFYSTEKKRGFLDAALEAGIQDPPVIKCPHSIADAAAFLTDTLADHPDTVIATHDELAVAFLKSAKRSGLSVPDECIVIGHGDLLLAECCEPELTTVNLHIPQLSGTAVSILMQVLQGEDPPHYITVAGDLHIRSTTDNLVL